MDESNLLRIALVSSLVGLVILFLISGNIEVQHSAVVDLNEMAAEQDVKITGVISSVKDLGKIMILGVAQPQTIDVMLFKEGEIKLQKGDFVELTGELREYRGKKEIIASKIEVWE